MSTRREYIILTLILLVSLLLRLCLFNTSTFIGTDAVALSRLGENLIQTGNYVFCENYNMGIVFPPGYPVFVGLMNIFIGDLFVSGKLVSLIASLGTTALFYLIGKELNNKQSGLFAALCHAVYSFIITTSVTVETESLFFLFLFLSIYLFVLSLKHTNLVLSMLLGLFSAMSYLVRPEGLLLLVLPFLSLKKGHLRKDALRTLATLGIFVLAASPYLFFLKTSTGRFLLSGKVGMNILIGEKVTGKNYEKLAYSLSPQKDQIDLYQKNTETSLISYIAKNPLSFVKRYAKNILTETGQIFVYLVPVMLPLLCSFVCGHLFRNKARLALVVVGVLWFFMYPLFYISHRYTFPVVVLLILFASTGFANAPAAISDLLSFCRVKKNKATLFVEKNARSVMLCLLLVSSSLYMGYDLLMKREIPVEHIGAGLFLRNIASKYEELNVMARKPWVSFYSDSKYTILPYANYVDVIAFARLYDVDYIVIAERTLRGWDVYKELVEMEEFSDDVDLVYQDDSKRLIKVLKLRK